ncbi:MAG: SLBB domain-containing protein [Lachnospiraceae bacterium]|nr:SLBB domain-containing protein [Lachnospiraceae bacterium]
MLKKSGAKLNKKYIIIFQLIIVILCGIWYTNYSKDGSIFAENENKPIMPEKYEEYVELGLYGGGDVLPGDVISSATQPYTDEAGNYIRFNVFVSGAVNRPGYYKLKTNNTVKDAIFAAEGFSYDAAVDNIDIDEILGDAKEIYIPEINDPSPCGIIERYDVDNIAFAFD